MLRSIIKPTSVFFYMKEQENYYDYLNYCSEENSMFNQLNSLILKKTYEDENININKSKKSIKLNDVSYEISFNKNDSPSMLNLRNGFYVTTDENDICLVYMDSNLCHPNKLKNKPNINLKIKNVR